MKIKLLFLLILISVMQGSCATYHKMPLDSTAVESELTPPEMAALRVSAREIRHPILTPIELNEKNGLAPDEAAILAVLVNPQLRAERAKRGVSAAQLFQTGILPNPQFSGSLDFPTGGSTKGTVNAFGLSMSYDTYSLITRGPRIGASQAKAASVDLDLAWKEWQVAETAKMHTYRLFLYEKQLAVASEEERGLRENFEAIKKAVNLHEMTILDLSAARASLEKVHLSVLSIQQNLEQERLALKRSIGFPPERSVHLQQDIVIPALATVPSLEVLRTGIEHRRLDLLGLRMGYNSQEEKVRAAILGQFPRISLGFSEARDTGNVVTSGFAVTIALPFFDRNQGQIAIERATRKELFDEYVARLFDSRSNVAKLRANLESIHQQIIATQTYLPALKNLVETYYRALLEGNADVLTYYNARDQLIASHIALLGLQLQWVGQFVALEIAAGEYLGHTQTAETPE
jgi:outer membrane protein TolC